MTTKSKSKKQTSKRPTGQPGRPVGRPPGRHGQCGRQRAPPVPNAIAWTLNDYQSVGGAGKTSLSDEDKKRRERGEKPLLFKDAFNRRMVVGDVGRELLGITDEVS
jgi:hypothetical protein